MSNMKNAARVALVGAAATGALALTAAPADAATDWKYHNQYQKRETCGAMGGFLKLAGPDIEYKCVGVTWWQTGETVWSLYIRSKY